VYINFITPFTRDRDRDAECDHDADHDRDAECDHDD
jgi:hypothetical protein